MPTKPKVYDDFSYLLANPKHPKPRPRCYVRWDRSSQTGRKLGIIFVVDPKLFMLVRLHRPTPQDPEWVGLYLSWGDRVLIDTSAWGRKR
jgi:hypothetical protein